VLLAYILQIARRLRAIFPDIRQIPTVAKTVSDHPMPCTTAIRLSRTRQTAKNHRLTGPTRRDAALWLEGAYLRPAPNFHRLRGRYPYHVKPEGSVRRLRRAIRVFGEIASLPVKSAGRNDATIHHHCEQRSDAAISPVTALITAPAP
jgi:hypothetical protein